MAVMRRHSPIALLMLTLASSLSACDDQAVGGQPDASPPDAAPLSCDPEPGDLACVEIVFPAQQTDFTQAEAAAGIDLVWELVVPDPVAEVYPANPNLGCCEDGVGPLRARGTVSGNQQYYCACDLGMCDSSGCAEPPALQLTVGQTTETFSWPGVNWFGPSDTGLPYGAPFPRGEYVVRVEATGRWRPPGSSDTVSYTVVGELDIAIIDGCGDGPAVESALWSCTGGVGEGGLCVDLTVDDAGMVTQWTPEWPLEPDVASCLDDAFLNDCFPSLAGTTERYCIYGV